MMPLRLSANRIATPTTLGPVARSAPVAALTPADRLAASAPSIIDAASPQDAPVRARHVAVSGIGVAGLMAAYSAINRAEDIGLQKLTLLDVRDHHYVLEIGFNFRPEHLRMMAVMSPKAARKLFDACGLTPGNEANVLKLWNPKTQRPEDHLSAELHEICNLCDSGQLAPADRDAILARGKTAPSMAHYAHAVADQANLAVVTAKDLEQIYFEGLSEAAANKGIELDYRPFSTIAVTADALGQKTYVTQAYLDANGKPSRNPSTPDAAKVSQPLVDLDVLFVAEGAGGAKSGTRAAVGETASRAITPDDQRWMAGLVKDPGVKHGFGRYNSVTLPDGSHLRAVRADHAVNGNQWRLVEIPRDVSLDPVPLAQIVAADQDRLRAKLAAIGRPTTDLEVEKAFHGERLEQLYRRLTAAVGDVDPDQATYNAFGQKGAPGPFTVAGRAYDRAVIAGGPANAPSGLPLTVALGDAVANSTFNVSLGAGTSLIEYVALDQLWDAVQARAPRGVAVAALERDLLQMAHTWGVSGISQFDGKPSELIATYYPKSEMEKVFPPDIVARYYTVDGQVRRDPQNRFWKSWVTTDPTITPAAVETVLRAAKKSPGPSALGPIPARV